MSIMGLAESVGLEPTHPVKSERFSKPPQITITDFDSLEGKKGVEPLRHFIDISVFRTLKHANAFPHLL